MQFQQNAQTIKSGSFTMGHDDFLARCERDITSSMCDRREKGGQSTRENRMNPLDSDMLN